VEPVDVPGSLEFGGAAPQEMNIILQAIMGTSVSARSSVDGSFVLKGFLPSEYNVQARRASNVEAPAGVPISERMANGNC
jgi:hypothetical protein